MKRILVGLAVCSIMMMYGCGGGGSTSTSSSNPSSGTTTTIFTAAMVSGKTFTLAVAGTTHGSITFNADGTISGATTGTWTINSSGQLVATLSTGEINTLTLTSLTSTVITATDTWTNPNNASDSGTGVATLTGTTGTPVFTSTMISGRTFTLAIVNGPTGSITFNADGTITSANTGTWTINSSGKLVITLTSGSSSGEIDTFTLTSVTATSISATDSFTNPTNSQSGSSTATFTGTVGT